MQGMKVVADKVEKVSAAVVDKAIDGIKSDVAEKEKIIKGVDKVISGDAKSIDKDTMEAAAKMTKDYMQGRTNIDVKLGKDAKGRDYLLRGSKEKDGTVVVGFGVSY